MRRVTSGRQAVSVCQLREHELKRAASQSCLWGPYEPALGLYPFPRGGHRGTERVGDCYLCVGLREQHTRFSRSVMDTPSFYVLTNFP